jgi:chromosome segregation ATPase
MTRKTAKDYRNELNELQRKEQALGNRIRTRALELCQQHPDIVVFKNYLGGSYSMTAERYAKNLELEVISDSVETNLEVIKSIEAELAARHPHKQLEMDYDPKEICNCDGRDMPTYVEDGKRWCPQCGLEVK